MATPRGDADNSLEAARAAAVVAAAHRVRQNRAAAAAHERDLERERAAPLPRERPHWSRRAS